METTSESKSKKEILLVTAFLVVVVTFTLGVHLHIRLQETDKPSFLKSGTYMIYEQFCVWNGHSITDYMTWNITKLRDNLADLHLISHGVNVTDGNVELTLGDFDLTINAHTREAINCSSIYYVGEKWPFWIETNVTVGSTIDIWYGKSVIAENEKIYVLGRQRDCWVDEYNWTTASMKRWYDKSSGICLKIRVVMYRPSITIITTETAVLTNVDLKS